MFISVECICGEECFRGVFFAVSLHIARSQLWIIVVIKTKNGLSTYEVGTHIILF